MNALIRWVLDLIYPPRCMLCHKLIPDSDKMMCSECEKKTPTVYDGDRSVPFFEKTCAAFYYEGDLREAILRYKFHGMRTYDSQFGMWMADKIEKQLEGAYDVVSWVPCSAMRRWRRDYDQAELLARVVARKLGVPCVRTLKKIKHNPKQSTITGEAKRKANVLGVYRVVAPKMVSGRRILLIDDVLTTGATLSECGKTLRLAGAVDPVCAVLAVAREKTDEVR